MGQPLLPTELSLPLWIWTTEKWKLSYWKSLGPAIHLDVTLTHTIYLNVVRDHEKLTVLKAKGGRSWYQQGVPKKEAVSFISVTR